MTARPNSTPGHTPRSTPGPSDTTAPAPRQPAKPRGRKGSRSAITWALMVSVPLLLVFGGYRYFERHGAPGWLTDFWNAATRNNNPTFPLFLIGVIIIGTLILIGWLRHHQAEATIERELKNLVSLSLREREAAVHALVNVAHTMGGPYKQRIVTLLCSYLRYYRTHPERAFADRAVPMLTRPSFAPSSLFVQIEEQILKIMAAHTRSPEAAGLGLSTVSAKHSWSDCEFRFHNTAFTRAVSFDYCVFNNRVNFTRCVFHGDVNLHSATFGQDLLLPGAVFWRGLSVEAATCHGALDLQGATCHGPASFFGATFTGPTYFLTAAFPRCTDFGPIPVESNGMPYGAFPVDDVPPAPSA